MKLYFTDETGNFEQGQNILRGGIIVDFENYFKLTKLLRSLKFKFFGNYTNEYKWSELSLAIYCQENSKTPGPKIRWLENYRPEYLREYLSNAVALTSKEIDCVIVSVADPSNYPEEKLLIQNQISHIMERFQFHLQDIKDYGMIIFDSINDEKDKLLKKSYKFFQDHHNYVKDFSRITDSLLSDLSYQSTGIQSADYIIGAISGALREYPFSRDIFSENIKPKLREKNGKIIGYGIKITPSENTALENLVIEKLSI